MKEAASLISLRSLVSQGHLDNGNSEEILCCITRLTSSLSLRKGSPNPKERLAIALAASRSSISSVAESTNRPKKVVIRAVCDTLASTIHVLGQEQSIDDKSIHDRIRRLRKIERRLQVSSKKNQMIIDSLDETPHVRELVDYFLEFGTVKPLLDELSVPSVSGQRKSIRNFLEAKSREDALNGIIPLAVRFVLARWLRGEGPYSQGNGDILISNTAARLFSLNRSQPSGESSQDLRDRISSMKIFLRVMAQAEYRNVIGNYKGTKGGEIRYFLNKDHEPARDQSELDMYTTYKTFALSGFCPTSIRDYASSVISGEPKKRRMANISLDHEAYSDHRWSDIDWAGIKFLENVLTSTSPKIDLATLGKNTSDILKGMKETLPLSPHSSG